MLRVSSEHHRSLAIGLFFICLILLLFTLSVEVLFPYFNPILTNPFLPSLFSASGYLNFPVIPSNSNLYSQNFSYQDYYAAYPYLQNQNISSGNENDYYTANNSVNYWPNVSNYVSGYAPYANYQSFNGYPATNYSTLSSNTYQTVSIYPNTNTTGNVAQNPSSQTGIYNPIGTYIPAAVQNNYYTSAQAQTLPVYLPYTGQIYPGQNLPQPNILSSTLPFGFPAYSANPYIPYPVNPYIQTQVNPYIQNQVPVSGYYRPNANYWPNADVTEPEPPVDIAGEYEGEWESLTTGEDGEICVAEIDQTDTQADGEIKIKEFVIEAKGKVALEGTITGSTVNFEIDLDGPILVFEGTVQSNGTITGSYTVEGSSDILDEGTITLIPK